MDEKYTQQTMFPLDDMLTPAPEKEKKKEKKEVKLKPKPAVPPATPLMKRVAAKAPNNVKSLKKVFSKEELAEIGRKGKDEEAEDTRALKDVQREKYRAVKRRVKELEIGNQSQLFAFPSLGEGGWYKMIEFSALFYAYRLADRMGRKARVMKDSDRFLKAHFVTSLTNIEKFAEDIKNYEEGVTVEIAGDGVYIFTLPKPVPDDEYAALRRTEETRRERLHNTLKPKDMDPAIFSALLMVERQLLPRIKKLEKNYYDMIGKTMAKDIHKILTAYGMLTDGLIERQEVGRIILRYVNSLMAGLILLAELRIWPYDVAALIGENANTLKRLILKDFIGKA